ncbi:MAG: OmpA family protein [Myxococcales bacterium]|nr:OmpA family protein [Myxococcales bacterium]
MRPVDSRGSRVRRRGELKGIVGALALGGAFLAANPASAQDTTFSLDRLRLGGAPDDGMGLWRPALSEKPRFYGQFMLGYSHNPFRIENHIQDDAQADRMEAVSGAPVRGQLTGYFDVGFEVWQRLGLQVMFPATFFQTGNPTFAASVPAARDAVDLSTAAPGDMRFEVRGVPVIVDDGFFKLGANANVFAPSGNDLSFTGDKSAHGGFGIAGELDWKSFVLVLDTGMHFRPDSAVNDFDIGHEWEFGLGGFVPIRDDRIRLGLTVFGSAMVTGDDAFKVETTPLEWMLEGKFAVDDKKQLYLNGFGGTRMAPGYAPDFRTGFAVGYWFNLVDVDPPSPPKDGLKATRGDIDTDKDGYPDNVDLCPTEPEDGKPPFTTDGCPGTDRDGDGIPDVLDKCPDVPEDKDGINDNDGCPEDDADKDDIPDAQDACPKEPGVASPDKEKNGCPQFIRRISGSNEIQVLKKVEFEFGSSRLSKASFPILDEVYKLLEANPEITLLSIEGHTDSVGSDALNLRLSKDRAKSCLDYLVQKGIKQNRLTSEGFGETKPIESNDTADGRAKNRRTEFHIRTQNSGPTPQGGAPKGAPEPEPGD